jgi:hypothetical protein
MINFEMILTKDKMNILKISGFLSLFFGTLATVFTFQFLIFAIPAAFLGYISSITFIFLTIKKNSKISFFNQGTVGMLLSSVPVFLVLYVIFNT